MNEVTAGALVGAVVDEVAVIVVPAGAPAEKPTVATCDVVEANVSEPPPVGIACVPGADVAWEAA